MPRKTTRPRMVCCHCGRDVAAKAGEVWWRIGRQLLAMRHDHDGRKCPGTDEPAKELK